MPDKICETVTRIPGDVLQWLEDRLGCIEYGEVGFTLVVVDHEVKRVRLIGEFADDMPFTAEG